MSQQVWNYLREACGGIDTGAEVEYAVLMLNIQFRVLTAALALAALTTTTTRAEDWPLYRGASQTGISKETGWSAQWPAEGPKQLWKIAVGTGFNTVSVSQGKAYTMGNANNTDTVYCLDANTGKELWKYGYPCDLKPDNFEGGPCGTPTVADGAVYTLARDGQVHALDAASGKVIWTKNVLKEAGAVRPQWGLAGSVFVEGKLLILNIGVAGTAVDKATGNIVWKSTGTGGYSTPVAFGQGAGRGVVLFSSKSVLAVAVADGKKLWEFEWKTSYDVNAADPILFGDKVFISSGYGRGCALIQIKGGEATKVWENKSMRNHFAACVYLDGYLYGFDGNTGGGELKCLDAANGDVKWAQAGLKTGGLMAADGKLIALADGGKLVIAEASPAGYKELASAKPVSGKCWTMPVLSNGRIYCRNNKEGDLVCYDVKK